MAIRAAGAFEHGHAANLLGRQRALVAAHEAVVRRVGGDERPLVGGYGLGDAFDADGLLRAESGRERLYIGAISLNAIHYRI